MPQNFTTEELFHRPEILLRKRGDPLTPLASYEGKVGAVISNGQSFITSPNMDKIYAIPNNDKMTIRTNMRLGDDDPLQWPQPYIPDYCHYAAIPFPKSNSDPNHYSAILYHFPRSNDFEPMDGESLIGLGHLSRPNLVKLHAAFDRLRTQLSNYQSASNESQTHPIFSNLLVIIKRQLQCLQCVPMTRKQVLFLFAEAQRYMLELMAAYRYQYVYRLRMMDDKCEPPTKIVGSVGAFTKDLRTADQFFRAGIPVWLVRPASLAGTVRVDSLVEVLQPQDLGIDLDDNRSRFPRTFAGPYGQPHKYTMFGQYSLSYISYPDPFNGNTPSSTAPSPSQSSTSHLGVIRTVSESHLSALPYRRRLTPKPGHNGGRDKFSPSENPLIPRPLSAWSTALHNVNRNISRVSNSTDLGYIFPEPALLVGPSTAAKQAHYLFNFVRYRQALIHRLVTSSSTAKPVASQLWRTLLNLPLNTEPASSIARPSAPEKMTKSNDRQKIIQDLLGDCLDDDIRIDMGPIERVCWRGRELSNETLPDVNTIHEIVWEVCELNFRFEFAALDRRACASTPSLAGQFKEDNNSELCRCFPGNNWSILVANIEKAHQGIAARDWRDRLPFVLAMRTIMEKWKGYEESRFGSGKQQNALLQEEFIVIETAVARFYTQSFFDYFGRAAVLPCSLPRSP